MLGQNHEYDVRRFPISHHGNHLNVRSDKKARLQVLRQMLWTTFPRFANRLVRARALGGLRGIRMRTRASLLYSIIGFPFLLTYMRVFIFFVHHLPFFQNSLAVLFYPQVYLRRSFLLVHYCRAIETTLAQSSPCL